MLDAAQLWDRLPDDMRDRLSKLDEERRHLVLQLLQNMADTLNMVDDSARAESPAPPSRGEDD